MAVEPVPFIVGPVSEAAATFLAGGTGAYAALTALYAMRAFKARLEDRWSATVCAVVLAGLAWVLWAHGPEILPAPFSVVLAAVFVAAIVVTLTFTLGRYQEKIDRFIATFGDRLNQLLAEVLPEERQAELQRLRASFALDREGRRKVPHLLMGVFVALYGVLGYLVLVGIAGLAAGHGTPEVTNNLSAASHADPGRWLVAGQVVSSFGLLTLLYILAPTELLRLRYPELSYPFKAVILSRLRTREKGLFGAHYYLASATPLAALWLTRDRSHWDITILAVVAVIAVSVFADAASALVGTRLGKRKWFHNPGKSYLGSAGGTVVALLVALPLVGLPMALATAAVFLVLDILAPVPFPVSDNLLNPVGLALCYGALQSHLAPWVPFY